MTFVDTSVIIDYLSGVDPVVSFVDEQETLLTSSICVYEVLEGEVFGPDEPDVMACRRSFGRIQALDFDDRIALEAARLQTDLQSRGETLAPRDTMIAATARSTGDKLVVADADFETSALQDVMAVTNLRS